jgi:hypothetical protein
MRRVRLFAYTLVIVCAGAGAAQAANKLQDIYDERELTALQPRYERGWRDNYDNVVSPKFTPAERARFANVRFHLERRIPDSEPFGFMAGGDDVFASTASLKFLEEITLAHTWLDMSGLSTQSLGDYLMMLRYWDVRRGRAPKPLEALCVPDTSKIDPKIVERATQSFDETALFVLLHEYGHAYYRHPGNAQVPPATSRANEQAADAFALDMFTRLKQPPIGVAILFFMMTHLQENRADDPSDEAYQSSLTGRTHPVSPERLQAFARNLTAQIGTYSQSFRNAQASVMNLALQVMQLSYLLGDQGIQRLSSRIGRTVSPIDLAPRPKGRHLSPACGSRPASNLAFDGTLRGTMMAGRTDFALDLVLDQNRDAVTGSFSYGAGYGRLEGKVSNASLSYRWKLSGDAGAGVLTLQGDTYRGTWGTGDSATNGGTSEVKKER